MKCALLDRLAGDPVAESSLLEEDETIYKRKLWLMSVQHAIRNEKNPELTLSKTPRLICDEHSSLPEQYRCGSSQLKSKSELGIQSARSMLELARQKNPVRRDMAGCR